MVKGTEKEGVIRGSIERNKKEREKIEKREKEIYCGRY